MKVYDEAGNLIGEIFDDAKEIISHTKDTTWGWFETSFVLGLFGLFIHPIIGILIWILLILLRILCRMPVIIVTGLLEVSMNQ